MNSHTFLKSIFFYIPVKVSPAIVNIITILILWRLFSSEEYLSYSICVSLAQIFAQISTGWVCNASLFYMSQNDKKYEHISADFYLCLISACTGSLIFSVTTFLLFHNIPGALILFFLCLSQSLFYFLSMVYQGNFLIRKQFYAVMLQGTAQLVILYYIFSNTLSNSLLGIFALTAGFSVAAIFLFVNLVSLNICTKITFSQFKQNALRILSYGAPMAIWMCANLVLLSSDRFLISYLSITSYEYVSLKDLLVGVSGLLSMPILMVVHPLYFKLASQGRYPNKIINDSLLVISLLFAGFWSIFSIPGLFLLQKLTGKIIMTPLWLLLVAYIGITVGCLSIYLQKRLEGHKKTSYLARIMCLSAFMSYFLGMVFGSIWGLAGIILSFSSAQLLYFSLIYRSVKQKTHLAPILLKSVLMGLFSWVIGQYVWQMINTYYPLDENLWGIAVWLVCYSPIFMFTLMPLKELSKVELFRVTESVDGK